MNDFIQSYFDHVKSQIEEEGIYPTPAISKDAEGGITLYAMAVGTEQIIGTMLLNADDKSIVEQIFALDCYTQDGQGTSLDSCLIAFHIERGKQGRVGVFEYSWNNGEPVTKPVNWNNEFWNKEYENLAKDLTRLFSK